MTCWKSCSSSAAVFGAFLAQLALAGSAAGPGEAAAALRVESLAWEGAGPPVAGAGTSRWVAVASGGSGELRYEFRSRRGVAEIVEQQGPSSTWDWSPTVPGTHRVKVAVEDGAGGRAESGWSSPVVVLPRIRSEGRIAVLPVENLTGWRAPVDVVGELMRLALDDNGVLRLDDEPLEEFLKRHRIRSAGAVDLAAFRALKAETGAEGVLVTSLEAYHDGGPPRAALFARLVAGGERAEIAWMDSVGISGTGNPGLFDLDRIDQPELVLEKAVRCLAESLRRALAGAEPARKCGARGELVAANSEASARGRFRPRTSFRSPEIEPSRRYRVAVIPFLNLSDRKNAGKIVALHFVNRLFRSPSFTAIEPGLVREQLLEYRIIMEAGPSLENAEVLSSQESLPVDLIFSGVVFDYQDSAGVPKVDFSVTVIQKGTLKVVWSSRSYNSGGEGVYFFDLGTVHTAHRLADEMARGAFDVLSRCPMRRQGWVWSRGRSCAVR